MGYPRLRPSVTNQKFDLTAEAPRRRSQRIKRFFSASQRLRGEQCIYSQPLFRPTTSLWTRWLSLRIVVVGLVALFALGCRVDMHLQPKYKPDEPSDFFPDGRADRPEVTGTVARGHLRTDELFYTGRVNGQAMDQFPFPVTAQVLERGRERYNIYCSPCHDYTGSGNGMIVQRGFPPPPSYHTERLRQAPAGHFFEVMTDGYGTMYSYAGRITPEDRWAIVAYIRALQLSQHASLNDVPAAERQKLAGGAK